MIDLNQFYAWQLEKPEDRVVKIDIDYTKVPRVFVYSHSIGEGQRVVSSDEIDLEGKLEEKEMKRYMELRAKFEREVNVNESC